MEKSRITINKRMKGSNFNLCWNQNRVIKELLCLFLQRIQNKYSIRITLMNSKNIKLNSTPKIDSGYPNTDKQSIKLIHPISREY